MDAHTAHAPGASAAPSPLTLIVFSHLRWDFVYQRPQQLLSRLAHRLPVLFLEEPVPGAAAPVLEVMDPEPGVRVLRPHVPSHGAGFHDAHSAQVQALRIVDERPDIDGIFVASDMMAAGLIGVLTANGYRIPEDVKVVGFDDSVVALATTPALTTVTNPGRELAGRATMMVLDQLEGREPTEPVILKPELIVRASA